ncbi:MAG: hypothetical protein GKR98_06445 [Boseongicola sp.]|nr:MAG: hypothetical protein GKR98_06445 [Boseongicola sp.]
MRGMFDKFVCDESGAITVDFVVLTAALVGLSAAVMSSMAKGALHHSDGLGAHLNQVTPTTTY